MSAQNQEREEGPIKSDTRIPTLVPSNTLHDKASYLPSHLLPFLMPVFLFPFSILCQFLHTKSRPTLANSPPFF
ncbi:hypothetical protein VIGAN_08106700 [Vigna angularis var. angularis]|uniref:Uncharacterized protein n=1 Tax=Vigna angularis var. angularis TaxID=157739 RepID=A0A0S3SNN8_PHAAN|nr:hypothetical protein VIGAN_08106700 [Vigna angularis var. angularis]